jgi:hypothetical protein
MADKKISELTPSVVELTDELVVARGGNNFKVTAGDVAELASYSEVASFAWKSNQTAPGGIFVPMPVKLTKAHLGMRRCLVLDNGTVNYYLDPQDSTKKADGTAATLTGADGMVMVEIPKFYTRRVVTDTITQWFVADSALPGYAVHPAFVKDGVEVSNRYYGAYDACMWTTKAITGITQANPAVVTSTGHGLVTGDVIKITGAVGMTEVNDQTFTVTAVDANTFSIGVDSTGYGAYTSGGAWEAYLSGLNLDNATERYVAASSKLTSISGIYPMVGLTRAEFRTAASNRGAFWRQVDFALWSAVQMLYLSEFQSFFSQNILGAGNTNGTYLSSSTAQSDSPHTIAGASNFMGNMSTNSVTGAGINLKPGTSFMCYRGIENFFGNCWNWADGINVNVTTSGNVHVTNNRADFADDTSTNMTLIATTLPTVSGFLSALQAIDNYFLASSVSGGSATTYMTDQHLGSASSNRVVGVGGAAADGALAGAFCVLANTASSSRDRNVGARLAG